MAGEWIKVRTNLWDDPRVSQLCDLTGAQEATIVGGLYWLWATADEHTETGLMPGLSGLAVDRKTGIKGFSAALVSIGWITDSPDGVTVLRFDEHNGASAKSRAQTAKRVANHKGNAKVTLPPLPDRYPAVTDALPREEKIREEEDQLLLPTVVADEDDVRKCPVGTLVDLYHELMPNNPRVKVLSDARKAAIRARWKEAAKFTFEPFGYTTKSEGIAKWRVFFDVCANSPFLTGLIQPEKGKTLFLADIDFIFSPAGFAKILENKYHRSIA